MQNEFDCVIIGGGPGGYVAAIRAAQKQLQVAIIENIDLGGTCLNRGCIPSKALIAGAECLRFIKNSSSFGIDISDFKVNFNAMKHRQTSVVSGIRKGLTGLIASNKITVLKGTGKFISNKEIKVIGENDAIITAKNTIIATGSEPRPFPGVTFNSRILDSTGILNLDVLPKKLTIIGGGVIGCEFASLFHTLGTEVTLIEILPNILPQESNAIGSFLNASFQKKGIKVKTGEKILSLSSSENSTEVVLESGEKIESEYILISIGRTFNSQDINLEAAGVICDQKGAIIVSDSMRTNIHNIYAIGDVTAKCMLAHVASHQALVAVDNIIGKESTMDYSAIPSVIFTHPEIATAGLTEEKALSQQIDVDSASFPLTAIGKAVALNETEGFAKIIFDKSTKQILGAQIIGPHASSLIGEMTLAIQNELTLPCIYHTIHAHPTLSEIWMECALLGVNEPIHMPRKK